jgi:hypothetical protein
MRAGSAVPTGVRQAGESRGGDGREVATAEVFGQCVLQAPTIEDKIRITRFQHEELKHYQLLAKLMSELGVDMDALGFIDSIRPVMAACGLRFPDRHELPLELLPQVELSVP